MTAAEAIARARALAETRQWAWLEPISATRARRWLVGRRRWLVVSNAGAKGASVRVTLDDETGAVIRASFLPR